MRSLDSLDTLEEVFEPFKTADAATFETPASLPTSAKVVRRLLFLVDDLDMYSY